MKEICHLSATEIVHEVKKKRYSAVEVMQAHFDRLEKLNPIINGLVQSFSRDECVAKAREADRALEDGKKLGKLHGLPVTIKDKHLVKGLISCVGCMGMKNKIASEDSAVVMRLKQEGAIVVGITNVPELLSSYETDNLVYGRTNNPYDLSKTAGGSSGGCAALVSAGCIPLSIGSEMQLEASAGQPIAQASHATNPLSVWSQGLARLWEMP
jgi:amidase